MIKPQKENKLNMSTQLYYYDDPEEGLHRDTSHPRFVSLASEDFYYDACDDSSPFGNDLGADTLSYLEDWYKDKTFKDESISEFLSNTLESWGLGPDDLVRKDPQFWKKWGKEKDEKYGGTSYLVSHCNIIIACGLGQLKITGAMDPEIIDRALASIKCLWFLYKGDSTENEDEDLIRLQKMKNLLDSVSKGEINDFMKCHEKTG